MKFLKTLKEFSKSVKASSPIKTQELYGEEEDSEIEKWFEEIDKKRDDFFKKEKKSSRKKIKDESHTISKEASQQIDSFLKGRDKKKLENLYFGVNKLIAQEEVKEEDSSSDDLGDLASMFEDNPKVNQEMSELEEEEKTNPAEGILNDLEKRKEEKSKSKEEVVEEPKEEEPKNYDLGKLLIIFDDTDYNSDIIHALKEAGFEKDHYKYQDRSYNTDAEGPDKYSKYVVDSKLVEADSRETVEDMFDDLLSELGSYYREGSIKLEGEGPQKADMEERIKKVS